MNWISFKEQRPKEEPKRWIRVRFVDGHDDTWWTGRAGGFSEPIAWAEIEPPKPVRAERVKAIAQTLREILRNENLTEERFRSRLESGGVDVDKFLDRFAPEPPPKPDPFEECWGNNRGKHFVKCDNGKSQSRFFWDAAIKWKEGQ